MPHSSKASPSRLLPEALVTLGEVDSLLQTFEKIQHRYLQRIRNDLRDVRQTVQHLGRQREISPGKARKLQKIVRDIHQLSVRPREARLKDLKRIESLAARSVSRLKS